MMNHDLKTIRRRKYKRWAMNVATWGGLWIAFLTTAFLFFGIPFMRSMGW